MVEIKVLDGEEKSYNYFLKNTPKKSIYYSIPFRNFLKEAIGGKAHYLTAWQNGQISGILPLFIKNDQKYGKVINSLPWYGSYGGIIAPLDNRETWIALLEAYNEISTADDVLSSTLISNPLHNDIEQYYSLKLPSTYVDNRNCQASVLPNEKQNTEEVLMSKYAKKTRNLVRKSLKQGFQRKISDEEWAWQFLIKTHQENMKSVGAKAKPREHFSALRKFIPPENRQLTIASLGDEPVAALLLLFFGNVVEYITPVIKFEYRSQQPLSFLIHMALKEAISNKFTIWNWGGTWKNQESLHHFKAGWGGVDYSYKYYIHSRSESIQLLKNEISEISSRYPYFYIFPYNILK